MNEKNRRTIRVILKDQAREEFEQLELIANEQQAKGEMNSEEMQLLKSIRQKTEMLKTKPDYGQKIPHTLFPKTLDVLNLFKVNLTRYWRMLYTLEGNRIEIVAFVLYIVDHPTCDSMFGYRKR